MKKFFLSITLVIVAVAFCGCSSFVHEFQGAGQYEDSFYKSFSYHDHRILKTVMQSDGTETVLIEPTDLVPRNFEETDIVNYYNRYEELLPLGESVQTLLSVRYSKETFDQELGLISQVQDADSVVYDTDSFAYPAYVSVLGWEDCSEYVLVDEENLTLHYVYLQSVTEGELRIDAQYLPKGYSGYGDVEGKSICIYE